MRTYQKKLSNNRFKKSSMKSVELVEGETIEKKVQRITENKEPITDGAPEIYTERKEGVLAALNIRTDRWELAAEAMDKVHASVLAARENKGKVIDLNSDKGDGGAEPTHGKEATD